LTISVFGCDERRESIISVYVFYASLKIEQTPPSPGYLDEEDENSMDRSPAVSPIGGKTSTIPATYQHITEEISAQGAGPGIYASNTMKSNFSVNTNGRQKEVVVPVIPAERTATPTGQSKSGGQSKATVRLLSDQDAEFHIPVRKRQLSIGTLRKSPGGVKRCQKGLQLNKTIENVEKLYD
jgi:hypothetical protein